MRADFRRRLEILERVQPIVVGAPSRVTAAAFVDFVAITFDRGHGSYADKAAHLYGLPDARAFLQWLEAGCSLEVFLRIAEARFGPDWQDLSQRIESPAADRARKAHGEDWADVLAGRLGHDNRVSRYQAGER